MEDHLHYYIGYSLVDITATGVVRDNNSDTLPRDQQRNWETVLQCLGLRTQPQHIQIPVAYITYNDVLRRWPFGDFYNRENQTVWVWSWAVESDSFYSMNNDPIGGLLSDFEQVPIITGLEETARFMLPIFHPHGAIKNIYFEKFER